jgi:hypothetical protein
MKHQDDASRPASAPSTQGASQPATAASSTAPASGKPQRVVLRVNRNLEVKGYLEREDDNTITVRDLRNQLQDFAKPHVGQIVRLVDPQPGQTGIVFMLDGQIREGIIIEDNFDFVIIEIEGIRANLKRATVSHVVLSPTVDEQYQAYKAAMQPGDRDAHLTLCQWLFEQKRYQLAHDELLDLLQQDEMPEARKLLNVVKAQLALQAPPEDGPASRPNPPKDGEHATENLPPAPEVQPISEQLLTDEDVNIIRVYEIDFDHPPRVTITPDTVRALIENYGTNSLIPASQTGRNALFRTAADNPMQIVRLMFELRSRDLYPKVQVNSEPYSLNLFRQRVHDSWLMNNCATTSCHGGPAAGRFQLHRRDHKDDRVRYTNLLILERLKLDPDWPLINYDRPEDSLLIQYGMSREIARKPHPRVDGWKPAFSQANPRLRQQAVDWIRAMMQPRPQYPVEYEPQAIGPAPSNPPEGPERVPP